MRVFDANALRDSSGRLIDRHSDSVVNVWRFEVYFWKASALVVSGRGQLKCDGTRAETRFRLSAKRTSQFKSAGGVSSVDYWQPRCALHR